MSKCRLITGKRLLISMIVILLLFGGFLLLFGGIALYALRHGYRINIEPDPNRRMKASAFFDNQPMLDVCDAISKKDMDRLRSSLDGVSINALGKKNVTLLLWALYKKNKEAFKLLLEKGADPNIQIEGNIRYEMDEGGQAKIYFTGDSVTSISACYYEPEYLKLVLQHHGDPNLINPFTKVTPLYDMVTRSHLSATDDEVENFNALIAAGADLEYHIPGQDNLLFYSIKRVQPKFILALLENGADYYTLKNNGDDCMMLLHGRLVKNPAYKDLRTWFENNGFDIEAAQKADPTWLSPTMDVPIEERPWLPQRRRQESDP